MNSSDTLPNELHTLTAIPDAVHVGKSMKCSWANWYLILQNSRSNLVMIRTLRAHAPPDIKGPLRKLLTLECVRNKDRMAVEPILKLCRPDVLEVLSSITLVVHTLLPETYRFWKSNQSGMYPRPVDVCVGLYGKLLVLDYNVANANSKLLLLRLHNPVDVTVLSKDLADSRHVVFQGGVAYVSEKSANAIRYFDLENK